LIGLRGMDPEAMGRTQQVALAGATLEIVGREDFVAMKAFAGGPLDLSDARATGPSGAVLLSGQAGRERCRD